MFLLAPSRGTYRVSRKLNSPIPSRSIITYLFHPAKWLYQSILPFCKLSSQNSFDVLFLLLSKLSWKLSLFFFWFKKRHLRRTAYQRTVLIFFSAGTCRVGFLKSLNDIYISFFFPFSYVRGRHLYIPMLRSGYSSLQAQVAVFLLSAFFHEVTIIFRVLTRQEQFSLMLIVAKFVTFHCSVFLILVNWGWRGGFFAEFTVWEDTFVQANRHILRKMHVVVLMKCESGADKTEIDCNVHVHGTFTP